MEKLVIAGREFNSRLFLGTGKFNNNQLMAEAIKTSETEMVTVAMKRIELEDKQDDLLSHIEQNLRQRYEQEVPSKAIGEEALAQLKDFDQVAYIRFASVYRRFTDIQSFKKELDVLAGHE